MSRPGPSEGTKPAFVLQIAPTGNSDNAFRLGPHCCRLFTLRAGGMFRLLVAVFLVKSRGVLVGYLHFEVGLAAVWCAERRIL